MLRPRAPIWSRTGSALTAVLLLALIALLAGPGLGTAGAASTLEGTWEVPNDSVNRPAGCSGFGGIESPPTSSGRTRSK